MNEFFKVNQDDSPELIKMKQITQKAIDDGDFEKLASIKLASTHSLVEDLRSDLDPDKDKEKIVLLAEFLTAVHQSYRDSIVYETVNAVIELVQSSSSHELVLNTLLTGRELVSNKMFNTSNKESALAKKMEEAFPDLRDGK
jgi:hypothetical protein